MNAVANGFTGGAGASYLNGWSIQPTAASKDFDNYAVYYSAMSSPGLDKARQWMTTYFLGWNRPEILFGSPSKSIVFNGIVTFTNSTTSDINSVLNSSAVTTIDGGKITTGSISADRIGTGTFTKASKGYFQMGLGTQYSIPGDITVATIGVFVSTSHDAALIAVNESSNIAFAAKTTSSANAALFNCGNNYGATVAAADCGFFSMRGLNSKLYGSSPLASNTRTWAKLSQDAVAAEIYYCHNTNGILKWKGVSIGTGGETPGYGLTVVGGTSPFTGCHDGIMPESAEEAIGDILVDVEVVRRAGISDTVTLVRYSNKINEKGVVGVLYHFSGKAVPHMFTKPVELIKIESGAYVRYTEYVNDFGEDMIGRRFIAMNSIGEGQVNVCGENGNIEIGDLITTSSIPGKGMKQADDLVRNYTVAKSRENVSFSSPTEIKQIACIYMCG